MMTLIERYLGAAFMPVVNHEAGLHGAELAPGL